MNIPILTTSNSKDWKSFVNFWSKMYYYQLEDKYNARIQKAVFDKDDMIDLYTWKNGFTLSTLKLTSLEKKIVIHLDYINDNKQNDNYKFDEHLKKFKDLSPVWSIFLLHLIRPKKYPIYDQHVHRAYTFITGDSDYRLINEKINPKNKWDFYVEKYLPFIEKELSDFTLKKVDEAFFTFGQFLKTRRYDTVVLESNIVIF